MPASRAPPRSAWNVYAWRQTNTTRVQVEVNKAVIAPPEGVKNVLTITVTNLSAHPIIVKGVGVYTNNETQTLQVVHRQGEIPGEVKARDSATTWIDADAPELRGEVIGWARVGTRKVYRSKPHNLGK